MAGRSFTAADHKATLELIARHGNVWAAAKASGIPRPTLQNRHQAAQKWLGSGAAVEKEPEIVEVVTQKPRVRVKAANGEGAAYRVLAMGDAHDDPKIPKDRFYWMGCHAAASGADWLVSIGDLATMDSLNSHIANDTLQAKQKNPYSDDMASLAEALGEIERGLGSHKPKKHIVFGNHERRAWLYEDQHPEMAGQLVGELTLLFEDRGWSWTEYGEFFFLGGVGFVHAALNRLGKTYGGKNAEQTIANDAVFDIVIGHSHTARVWRAPKIGPSQFVNVVNLGCALPQGHIEDYAKHATTGWTWGIFDLLIRNGHIESASFVSMPELERRYAKAPR
jgi:predicted phosphodiesterase